MLDPIDAISADPAIAALPKADLHVHAEASARLDRVLARRGGRPAFDWRGWAARTMRDTPAGMPRLLAMGTAFSLPGEVDAPPENVIARIVDLLEEAGADGAVLVEVRFGRETVLIPDFMALFREAERRARARYPRLRAEAISTLVISAPPEVAERLLSACVAAARAGLAGIDLLPDPYATEADPAHWAEASRWAARARDAGLGITNHAAEFSPANLAAALRVPGVQRIGHAVHAARDPRLLESLAASGVTVECCPTCNVVLGAVASYADHPIRQLMAAGIPVTLNSDDPVRVGTTIGREYAVAAALGLSPAELLALTRTAIQASFAPAARRAEMLAEVDAWN
jgi:adenosine deaminase